MGKCCVTGCSDLEINTVAKTVYYDGGELHEGDTISVDGSKGDIYIGEIETVRPNTVKSSLNLWNGQRILHA